MRNRALVELPCRAQSGGDILDLGTCGTLPNRVLRDSTLWQPNVNLQSSNQIAKEHCQSGGLFPFTHRRRSQIAKKYWGSLPISVPARPLSDEEADRHLQR